MIANAATNAVAIDKPDKGIAAALQGKWMAPLQGYNDPEVGLALIPDDVNFDPYSGMPQMSSIPTTISRIEVPA